MMKYSKIKKGKRKEDIINIYIALIIRLLIDVCLFFIILHIGRVVQHRKENIKNAI